MLISFQVSSIVSGIFSFSLPSSSAHMLGNVQTPSAKPSSPITSVRLFILSPAVRLGFCFRSGKLNHNSFSLRFCGTLFVPFFDLVVQGWNDDHVQEG